MIDAAKYLATKILRDGRTITIRAQRPEDLEVGPGGLVEHQGGLEREAPERVDVPCLGALGVLEVPERRAGSRHRPG